MTKKRGQRGFTLLELLITLSVTTIGLVGLLALHQSVVRGNDGASRSAEAQQIGMSEIEALRALRLDGQFGMMKLLTGSMDFILPTPPQSKGVLGRGGVPYTVTTTVVAIPGASASLMRIRVVTSWAEGGGTLGSNGGQLDHSLALEIIRTQQEAL